MSRTYVLDANAVLNLVQDEVGAERMERLIEEAVHQGTPLLMSVLNWGEVFYHVWQRRGEEKARQTMGNLSRLPLDLIPVDLPQVLKAGEIKAVHKIPYVDCIAAALAETRQAILVTSDRDFEKLGRRVPVLWLARP
ncbi:putative PilT protein-like [Candidatus Sulfotelmatobacter kueseliae]|jgi:predicted nucleic acid-binding protein|uniref:Ribonuclease VapC n=1 Tax=Candidatus Sulfotelmatobacter kueseliae TaxID=2042962 RepID=A0A2U3K1J3_9BACT|nr:putative PilT protein-like [Candidatus Sulfotelmatobacter kueseliae]